MIMISRSPFYASLSLAYGPFPACLRQGMDGTHKMGRGVVLRLVRPAPPPALYSHRLGGMGIAGEVTVFTVSREGKRVAGGGTTRKPLRKISPPHKRINA